MWLHFFHQIFDIFCLTHNYMTKQRERVIQQAYLLHCVVRYIVLQDDACSIKKTHPFKLHRSHLSTSSTHEDKKRCKCETSNRQQPLNDKSLIKSIHKPLLYISFLPDKGVWFWRGMLVGGGVLRMGVGCAGTWQTEYIIKGPLESAHGACVQTNIVQ